MRGTIRKFIPERYFGFIRGDGEGVDTFCHGSEMRKAGLNPDDTGETVGSRVSFQIDFRKSDGKPFATNVEQFGRGPVVFGEGDDD